MSRKEKKRKGREKPGKAREWNQGMENRLLGVFGFYVRPKY